MSVTYSKHPLTAGRIVDGVAFVVTANDNRMHSLNRTASHIWALCEGSTTIDEAANALTAKFNVDIETARADVAECFADLVAREILITN